MYPIILASTSPYRAEALRRLGVTFSQVGPNVDESALQTSQLAPLEIAQKLAAAKTQAVARQHPNAIIIGSDQLVSFAGEVLGKPGSLEAATDQLCAMAGSTHQLITAVNVASPDGLDAFHDITSLTMRQLDRDAIHRYVVKDQPVDCAGSYKIEGGGMALFSQIETTDHSAIVGLPLIGLVTCLRNLGHAIP